MFCYLSLPACFLREAPSLEAKIATEALFAEKLSVLEKQGTWIKIQTPDDYSGWIEEGKVLFRSSLYLPNLKVSQLKAHLYREKDVKKGPFSTLPFGVGLVLIDSLDERWLEVMLPTEERFYIQSGDVEKLDAPAPFDLLSFSTRFLGLPYTWGGRSSFGFDCSGYVQMLYSQMGISLPRDAWQQAKDPKGFGVSWNELQLGDLLFWGEEFSMIQHVGMALNSVEFIHTSVRENKPYLRMSKITDREWRGEGSYPFYMARRFLSSVS